MQVIKSFWGKVKRVLSIFSLFSSKQRIIMLMINRNLRTWSYNLLKRKKSEIMPFAATWMDREIVILSEVRKEIIYHITCLWNLKKKKKIQMNLYKKQKYRLREWIYGYQGGVWGKVGMVRKFGIDIYTLLYLKWITNTYCIVQRTLFNVI